MQPAILSSTYNVAPFHFLIKNVKFDKMYCWNYYISHIFLEDRSFNHYDPFLLGLSKV